MKISNRFFAVLAAFVFCLCYNFSIFADVGKPNAAPKAESEKTFQFAPPVAANYGADIKARTVRSCRAFRVWARPKNSPPMTPFVLTEIRKYGINSRIFQPPEVVALA